MFLNLFFPFIDLALLIFVPLGLILLALGNPLLISWISLLVIPFGLLLCLVIEIRRKNMLKEIECWKKDFATGKNPANGEELTEIGKIQFRKEIDGFGTEIKRFKTGINLIEKHNMVRQAFCYMNQTFKMSAKGYSTWRLFQIVFIVSLILDIVANEPELMLEESLIKKAKTNDVDILYFPTGGGKTEAFLGIMVFNLFFDRIRGKEQGVTAILKYPLRLLSVQQVQRVSNILAAAEII